ncbi:LD-carboxypeptidase [Fulvivirga sp. RKSG066]|uniref:S66 peptidase family protein n=1 Tax=Fulvivirga aurantia TaxID=2529383 RepID=UPI0012BCB883|nr:LD-carboxypeptidase [Fulvivirga aurantia]MTI19706.1 LD-carboxypeptidase [Fulvivirga aurantia]
MSIVPRSLKKGDRVGLVAPSRVITKDQMKAAYEILASWGLNVQEGKSLYNKYGYFAGRDEERLDDLQNFINDENIAAIFCARGGYGMTRIVDELDLSTLKTTPKWIIGFSDITALHLALNKNGLESIHGLMPVQYGKDGTKESLGSLQELIFHNRGEIIANRVDYNRNGSVSAEIVGGNLSLVAESLGTKSEIETIGKILFLEEVDEYLYKIDRMFTQLHRTGKLKDLAGLVIGDFSDMKDTEIKFGKDIHELILSHVNKYDYPMAFGMPIGHESKNLAIPVGRVVDFEVNSSSTKLTY